LTQETHPIRTRIARIFALLALAVSGVVASFATIAPTPDAELLVSRAAVVDRLQIQPNEGLVPPNAWYIREERFQRGDTFTSLLVRLGVGETDIRRVLRTRALRLLRPGYFVTAHVGDDGSLNRLAHLAGRDTLVSVTREGDGYRVSEVRAARLRTALRRARWAAIWVSASATLTA